MVWRLCLKNNEFLKKIFGKKNICVEIFARTQRQVIVLSFHANLYVLVLYVVQNSQKSNFLRESEFSYSSLGSHVHLIVGKQLNQASTSTRQSTNAPAASAVNTKSGDNDDDDDDDDDDDASFVAWRCNASETLVAVVVEETVVDVVVVVAVVVDVVDVVDDVIVAADVSFAVKVVAVGSSSPFLV